MDVAKQTAAVTGAASGIGLALCRVLLDRGANVVGIDRDADGVAQALAGLGAPDRTLAVGADVTDLTALLTARARAEERFGRVDLIANNAGIGGRLGPTWELTDEDWDTVLDVNVRGVVNGIRAFVPGMIERGHGHVVNTASMAGLLPMPFGATYVASKHAVVGISSTLRMELARAAPAVGVSVLCPGWTDTGIASSADAGVLEGHGDGPAAAMAQWIGSAVAGGTSAVDVAEAVASAVEGGEYWILTHPEQSAATGPYWAEATAAMKLA